MVKYSFSLTSNAIEAFLTMGVTSRDTRSTLRVRLEPLYYSSLGLIQTVLPITRQLPRSLYNILHGHVPWHSG